MTRNETHIARVWDVVKNVAGLTTFDILGEVDLKPFEVAAALSALRRDGRVFYWRNFDRGQAEEEHTALFWSPCKKGNYGKEI